MEVGKEPDTLTHRKLSGPTPPPHLFEFEFRRFLVVSPYPLTSLFSRNLSEIGRDCKWASNAFEEDEPTALFCCVSQESRSLIIIQYDSASAAGLITKFRLVY